LIEVLFGAVWTCLGVYIVWYFFKAETLHPLSGEDLTTTWQLHKNQTGCRASTIDTIHVKNDCIVGFTCNCGYNYMHKRSITQKPNSDSQPKINDLIKSDKTIQKMGLTNAQINKL
jgi:hypothetical protein